jgi:hypothetical protein
MSHRDDRHVTAALRRIFDAAPECIQQFDHRHRTNAEQDSVAGYALVPTL